MQIPKTRIILLRHGETVSNLEKKLSGHTDPPLTTRGENQALAQGEMLRDVRIDRIFSSPFSRAGHSAEAVAAGRDIEIETLDGLAEQNFGDWEGKTLLEVMDLIPGGARGIMRGPYFARFPSGEGTEYFLARVIKTYRDEILPGSEGKTIVLATHSGVITLLMCHFLGLNPFYNFFRIRIENGSVSAVDRYDLGLYSILYLNRV